jgi:hypothetical protein
MRVTTPSVADGISLTGAIPPGRAGVQPGPKTWQGRQHDAQFTGFLQYRGLSNDHIASALDADREVGGGEQP